MGVWLLSRAFDCNGHGATAACQPLQLTLFQSFVTLSVLIVGLMIPAAPGSAGTFQAAVKVGLLVFLPEAVVLSSGVAFANVLWLAQILQQIAFGVVLMLLSHRSFRDLAGKMSDQARQGDADDDSPKADAQAEDSAGA